MKWAGNHAARHGPDRWRIVHRRTSGIESQDEVLNMEVGLDDVVKTDGVLDLRPARDSLVYQLLRLGLSFNHKHGETWTDYRRGVIVTFTGRDTAADVIIADMDTKDSRTVAVSDLADVTEVKTWRSDGVEG